MVPHRADRERRARSGPRAASSDVRRLPVALVRLRRAGSRGGARARRAVPAGVSPRRQRLGRAVPSGSDAAAGRRMDRRSRRSVSGPGRASCRDAREDRRVERAGANTLPCVPRGRGTDDGAPARLTSASRLVFVRAASHFRHGAWHRTAGTAMAESGGHRSRGSSAWRDHSCHEPA